MKTFNDFEINYFIRFNKKMEANYQVFCMKHISMILFLIIVQAMLIANRDS